MCKESDILPDHPMIVDKCEFGTDDSDYIQYRIRDEFSIIFLRQWKLSGITEPFVSLTIPYEYPLTYEDSKYFHENPLFRMSNTHECRMKCRGYWHLLDYDVRLRKKIADDIDIQCKYNDFYHMRVLGIKSFDHMIRFLHNFSDIYQDTKIQSIQFEKSSSSPLINDAIVAFQDLYHGYRRSSDKLQFTVSIDRNEPNQRTLSRKRMNLIIPKIPLPKELLFVLYRFLR